MKSGHAYVSYGPLIQPSMMFGSELKVKSGGTFNLAFKLKSVTGLKQAKLIGAGSVAAVRTIANGPHETSVEFPLTASKRTWYSIEVEDIAGRKAFSNPIWVDVVELSTFPPAP